MFIPSIDVPTLFNSHSTILSSLPLDGKPHFSLDMAGVTGVMGGDDAVAAMAAAHVCGNGRWLGFYNAPGSFHIAKRLRAFAKSASLPSLSQSVHTDPTTLFELDSCKGPKFRAAHSGTVIEETGQLAALFMKECTDLSSEGKVVPGRKTQPVGITVAQLGHTPSAEMHPTYNSTSTPFLAGVPIVTSVGTGVLSALGGDWYASSLILIGIIASGVSCYVLGSADFLFTHPEPAKGSPAGDGILSTDRDIVVLKGTEGAVNSITRGRFSLQFSSVAHYNLIRWCSSLFIIQFITQLLLIPQASLFGQIMFLISFGVSALYNAWLSSNQDKIYQRLLFERVLGIPAVTKYTLGTRTSAVVFMLLVLQLQDPTALLNELLPNDTKVWRRWKATIVEQLRRPIDKSFLSDRKSGNLDGWTQQERDLLATLYDDAQAAYNGYSDHFRVDAQ